MSGRVVITGVGFMTPGGSAPAQVLARVREGRSCAAAPSLFDARRFACTRCAEIRDFDPLAYVPEPKAVRMMSRDAQFAVAAAQLAVADAQMRIGRDCSGEEVGLFGATGLAGVPLGEVAKLVEGSAGADGALDLRRFGEVALKQVRPVLSFKILSNMPLCFVSIFQQIQGPNAVFNPWEGQGAAAIVEAIRAIQRGEVRCALAGGCDVKTHELGFLALHQQGAFDAWRNGGAGPVPAEGAAFLVLEDESTARARGARILARIGEWRIGTGRIQPPCDGGSALIAGEDAPRRRDGFAEVLHPKSVVGNLFAAAAAAQVGIGALVAAERSGPALVECCGHGSQQAAFRLEGA